MQTTQRRAATGQRKGRPTPSRRKVLAENRVKQGRLHEWLNDRAEKAMRKAQSDRKARRAAGPTPAAQRVPEGIKRAPSITATVTEVERDGRGRMLPHRNPDKDRTLRGKARVRARRSAR